MSEKVLKSKFTIDPLLQLSCVSQERVETGEISMTEYV